MQIWAATWQNQQSDCAPSEDSDQPGHPPSLISVFAVRMKEALVLSYPLSAQRRPWSDWADAQADLNLRWVHSHIVGFVTRRLICRRKKTLKSEKQLWWIFEPSDEIMVLFVLRKLILQTRMHSHPVGLHVWFLVGLFVYFHTSCVRTEKTLSRMHRLAWAFPGHLCSKYHTLMSWLIWWWFWDNFPTFLHKNRYSGFSLELLRQGVSNWYP